MLASSTRVSFTPRSSSSARAHHAGARDPAARAASGRCGGGPSAGGGSTSAVSGQAPPAGCDVGLLRLARPAAAPGRAAGSPGPSSPRPGSTVSPAFSWRISLGRVLDRQRAHVAAVEGRHRRHVAGAEALELAQLHVLEALRAPPPRRSRRRPLARCAGGRPRSCTRTRSGAPAARCAACRRRSRRSTGRRASPASPRPPAGSPRASTSRAPAGPRRAPGSVAEWRSGYVAHQPLDLGAQRVRHVDRRRDRGSSPGRPRGRPPRPSRAGASSRGSRPRRDLLHPVGHQRSTPPRIGSSIATQAMKSASSVVARHLGQRLEVHEARVAHVHARGLGRAVGEHEAAELAARRLDRRVGLARRHAEALGHELEVVDQRLHRGGQLVARRQRDLAVRR